MNNDQRQGWLAALLDGEGNLSLQEKYSTIGEVCLDIRVCITNTNLELLEKVKSVTGFGSIAKGYMAPKSTKLAYRWTCPVGHVREFLEITGPLLIVKRRKAEIILQLLDTVKNLKPGAPGYKENVQRRLELLEVWENEKQHRVDTNPARAAGDIQAVANRQTA